MPEFDLGAVTDIVSLGFMVYEYWKQKKKDEEFIKFRDNLSKLIARSFDFTNMSVKENILEAMFSGFRLNLATKEIYAVLVNWSGSGQFFTVKYNVHGVDAKSFSKKTYIKPEQKEDIDQKWISDLLQSFYMTLDTNTIPEGHQESYGPGFFPKNQGYVHMPNLDPILGEMEELIISGGIDKDKKGGDLILEFIYIPPLIDHQNKYLEQFREKITPFIMKIYSQPKVQEQLRAKIRDYFTQVFSIKILETQMIIIEKSLSKNLNIFLSYLDGLSGEAFASWWLHFFDKKSEFYLQPFTKMKYVLEMKN